MAFKSGVPIEIPQVEVSKHKISRGSSASRGLRRERIVPMGMANEESEAVPPASVKLLEEVSTDEVAKLTR